MLGKSVLPVISALLLCAGPGSGCRARPGEAQFAAARQAFAVPAPARKPPQDRASADTSQPSMNTAARADVSRVNQVIDAIRNGHEGTAGVLLAELQRKPELTAEQLMALHDLARVLQLRMARRLAAGDPQAAAERNSLQQALAPR